jgi:hypothetical protein
MCPEEVQYLILQRMDNKTTYEDLRDKVVVLSHNRAGEAKSKPMEVDQVKEGTYDEWHWDGGEYYESGVAEDPEKHVEVLYVCEACLRCGGMGHTARECPTPKGNGKGGGKNGNWYGKDGFGYKGYKGGGKDGWHKGYKSNSKDGFGKNGGDKGKGKVLCRPLLRLR